LFDQKTETPSSSKVVAVELSPISIGHDNEYTFPSLEIH